MENMNLPSKKKWVKVKLEDLASTITKGSTPTTYGFNYLDKGILFIKIENIENDKINHRSIKQFISNEAHEYQSRSQLQEGDILFSIAGTIGKTCIVTKNDIPSNTNQALSIIRGTNKYLLPKFLKLQFLSILSTTVKKKARGGAMSNISLNDLKRMDILLPSIQEQNRIVEKTEELFSDLDKATEDLNKSQEQLKIYRQAVLKKLLTNKNWKTQKLKNMCTITSSKRIFKKEYVDKGVPFYRTKEIVELSKGKKISFELYISSSRYNEIKDKFDIPTKGDILISAVGTIGISYIVPDNTPFYFKDGNILWIKNLKYLIPQFLNYILNHFVHSKIKNITAGTAYSALTIEKLKNLEVPTPTHDIQNQIVNEIESRLSVCDKLEETVQHSVEKIEYLLQSILKKAFEGKLVPQDPNDEPAEKLLERIKQEKEKFESNNKKRKKR